MRFCSPAPAGAPGSFFSGLCRGQACFAAGPAAPAPCAILFLCTRGSVSLSRCQVAQFDRLMQGKGPLYWNLHKI